MAQRKGGYLGWIIIAGASIAWFSGGHEDKVVVSPLPVSTSLPTFNATQNTIRSASQSTTAAAPASVVDVPITREVSAPTAPKPGIQPRERAPVRPMSMSTSANVRLRSSQAADAPVLATLGKGTAVEVVSSDGDRLQVNVPSLNVTGWVHKSYLTESSATARPAPALAATEQAPPKPQASATKETPKPSKPAPGTPIRAPVKGSCDCPYDYARNGSRCGGRSAYSRPGGREPMCFYE